MDLKSFVDLPLVRVEAYKFDRTIHRTWKVRLVEENSELWTFVGVFETEVRHALLGVIRRGTISFEYYWKNLYFNVFRFCEPTGELKMFYCNINLPPILQKGVLSYVDLDIDVLVQPNFNFEVVDLEEFAENAERLKYPLEIISRAHEALDELTQLIKRRQFPFNIL
jgi:protein associated with RNAse G/E